MNQFNSGPQRENGEYGQRTPAAQEGLDLKGILLRFLRNWYWFVLCLAAGTGTAWAFIHYSEPVYSMESSLLIRDEGANTGVSENLLVAELGYASDVDFNSELEILASSNLMEEVVDSLDLNLRYFREGNIRDGELYDVSPLVLSDYFPLPEAYGRTLRFRIEDAERFALLEENGDTTMQRFGAPFRLGSTSFKIDRIGRVVPEEVYYIQVLPPARAVRIFGANLRVERLNERSKVIALTVTDPLPDRARDIILTLIDKYDQSIVNEKNQVGQKTLAFINERLGFVTQELYTVEEEIEAFKRDREVPVDLTETAGRYLEDYRDSDQALIELDLRLRLMESIKAQFLADTGRMNPLPVASEVLGPTLTSIILDYNSMIAERNRILAVATPENPIAQHSQAEMRQLESNLLLSIDHLQEEIRTRREEIAQRIPPLEARLAGIPGDQREFLQIMRQQQIKENLFTFLLQKREETALSLAAQVPNSRIIGSPRIQGLVYPDPKRVYTLAILLALLLPAGILTLRELTDNKVRTPEDVQQNCSIPYLGTIGLSKETASIVVRPNSRSALAEMFRSLRTNLHFMGAGHRQQVILVTSTFSGEGKTFLSVNLGASLALSGKRTVILGFDLRKPKLHSYLTGRRATVGLSNFLVSDAELDILVKKHDSFDNLFYIGCGPLPPNPAELIGTEKVKALFAQLREQFDYILIDSPPVGLVTDAFLLGQHADSTILVSRAEKTRRTDLHFLGDITQKRQLPSVGIVLTGYKTRSAYARYGSRYQYGYYDGYYQEDEKKGWLETLKSRIS